MDDLPKTSYYKTLGVPKDATLATIRSAYRKLVLSCHPDKTQDEAEKAVRQEKFHEVQEAYETLSDESKRHKYDEKVKLAELRAERSEGLGERSMPRRTDDYYGASRPPRYDMYDGVRYEVRVPPSTPRTYDRDTYTAEYPEERRSAGKYDDRYTSRRTSGRGPEDRRRAREVEEERERERRMKEKEREAYARDSRKRDKDRKKDYEAKSSRKFAHVDDEDSDSEIDDRYFKAKREPAPKARYEEPRKRSGDEGQRKSYNRDSKEYADSDLELKTGAVKEYIKNNKSRETVEPEPSRRPAHTRTASKLETRTSQPPPPPSHPTADSIKHSSGRGRGGSRAASPIGSKKDRRTPGIFETPSRGKHNVSTISSAPKGMSSFVNPSSSGRGAPHRSATYQDTTEYKRKPLPRSETMPVDRMHRGETRPLQTSTLKNMKASSDNSGSSSESESEVTEEIYPKPRRPSPRQKSTSYRYTENDGDNFVLEPEEISLRRGEESSSNRRPSLPVRGSTTRAPTTGRSMPHAYPSDERSPRETYARTESARGPPPKAHHSPKLFREYSPPHEESPRTKHSSPKVYTDEVRHADKYVRRGSEDVPRDAWPGKFNRRPPMNRNETAVR